MASIDVLTATGASLQALLADGSTTTEDLVDTYLNQIHKHNHYGMRLNAVISVAPRDNLIERARALDEERKTKGARGPLHGIPVIVKDLHCTASLGMPTTAGMFSLANAKAKRDAATVERLIEAGAIVIAKSNLSELGYLKSKLPASGWSAIGGQIQCPYVRGGLRHDDPYPIGHSNPSGSSGGSAVSVAAGFSPIAIGDEMEGSLTSPATRNALYTLKPTPGSVPSEGIFCTVPRQVCAGAMAKCARDLVDTTAVLMGKTFDEDALHAGWKGLKIGVLEDCPEWDTPLTFMVPDERVTKVIEREQERFLAQMVAEGAEVTRKIKLPGPNELIKDTCIDSTSQLPMAIMRDGVNRYLDNFEPTYTIDDIIAINKANPHYALPPEFPEQEALEEVAAFTWPGTGPGQSYEETTDLVFGRMRKAIDDLGVDIVLASGDMFMMTVATMSGSPLAAFPVCGTDDEFNGRRIGMCALATAGKDEVLLRMAMAWNKSFPRANEPPRMLVNWDRWVDGKGELW